MNHSHAPAIIDELYTSLCSLFYPGVNSRAELVTLAPGLRPERRFAPLARGNVARFAVGSFRRCCMHVFLVKYWNDICKLPHGRIDSFQKRFIYNTA